MNTYSPSKEQEKKSFIGHVSEYKFDFSFDDTKAIKFVPKLVFLTILGVLYIANTYYADRMIREISTLHKEVEELRVDYGSYKYEYIHSSKYAEISQRVRSIGLIENDEPVTLIEVTED